MPTKSQKERQRKKEQAEARQQEMAEAWEIARNVERELDRDVRVPDIGIRRVRVIVMPAFTQPYAWEIREREECFRLYRSTVMVKMPQLSLSLLGYDELESKTRELRRHLDRLWGMSIPVVPDLTERVGRDGVGYELVLFGNGCSQVRFEWHNDGPRQWRPLIDTVMKMIEDFKAAAVLVH